MGWLRRYRHGRGFGIHSPFAYRLITEVLREELPYYDFAQITDSRQQLIYRIACRFRPHRILSVGGADISAVLKACSQAAPYLPSDLPWDMAIVEGACDPKALMQGQVDDCIVILRGRHAETLSAFRQWLDTVGYGMTFDNATDMAIIAVRRKLPRQDFEVQF